MDCVQRLVPDDCRPKRAAPQHISAEVGVVYLGVGGVDAGLEFGDELVDGVAGFSQPLLIDTQRWMCLHATDRKTSTIVDVNLGRRSGRVRWRQPRRVNLCGGVVLDTTTVLCVRPV